MQYPVFRQYNQLKRSTMILTRIICLIIALLIAHNGLSQKVISNPQSTLTKDEMITNIKEYIGKEMSGKKIAGLSVAIVDTNGIVLSEGFGMADKENNIKANNSTLFPIASVTKTFTGIAIMQLVEKGLIDLDKPISDYIPELSLPDGEEKIITTRMLLTHHSGIHGDILYNWYLPEVSKDPFIYEQVIDLINDAGTIFAPGKLHSYSNAGYSLLGVLIHRVSGTGYVEYIHTNIFDPLGMKNSIVYAGEAANQTIARGYAGKKSMSMPMKLGIPAGGIALSADDAAKYMMGVIGSYHDDNTLLKKETMLQMMTQQNSSVPLDKGFSIGLTWFLQDPLCQVTKYASHRGELPPYYAMMIILPEIKTGVFISVNTNSAADAPYEMAHKIIYDLYNYQTGRSVPQIKNKEVISLNREQLKQYEGIYPNVYFGPMKVKSKSKKLIVESPVMPASLVLIPHADTTFSVKTRFLGFTFSVKALNALKVEFRENEGDKYMYFIIQNSMLNPNLKTDPFEIPGEYTGYAGKYNIVNMENSGRVVRDIKIKINSKGKFSVFKYTFLGRHHFNMVIQPIDKQNARFAGTGYFMGDKIHWEKEGGKVIMYWSGLKLEKE